jgi:hypothetical protein
MHKLIIDYIFTLIILILFSVVIKNEKNIDEICFINAVFFSGIIILLQHI